ncbi:MAG: hypothetical protein SGARI_006422, partial [Bacillariaceae sp.]
MKTAAEIANGDRALIIHYMLPVPVGFGRQDLWNDSKVMDHYALAPELLATAMCLLFQMQLYDALQKVRQMQNGVLLWRELSKEALEVPQEG